jgi:hypothetical protein
MKSSAQKLALTQLSGGRDMSMLLAQSAVSVRPRQALCMSQAWCGHCKAVPSCATSAGTLFPMLPVSGDAAHRQGTVCALDRELTARRPGAQPGIASVYSSIVQQTTSGVEFYIRAFPELEGLTYGAARRAFPVPAPATALRPCRTSGTVYAVQTLQATQAVLARGPHAKL